VGTSLETGAFVPLNFVNKSLSLVSSLLQPFTFIVFVLILHIFLSEITCLDLALEFILLPTCSRSYLLIPSKNRSRIEILSTNLLFHYAGPDLFMGIQTSLSSQTSLPHLDLFAPS
jgi:hypothetical protein